jgi:hypothetical protein
MKRAFLALAVAAVEILTAPYAQGDTTIFVDGLGDVTPMSLVAQLVPSSYSVGSIERVDYPAEIWPAGFSSAGESIAIGVPRLNEMIYTASMEGYVYVVGGSLGAMVIDQELRDLATHPNPPDPHTVSFVQLGNPTGRGGVLSYGRYGNVMPVLDMKSQPAAVTPYAVMVVTNQYDGLSNFPDRPWNLLAVANAIVGAKVYHNVPAYAAAFQAVMDGRVAPENITTTVNELGGVTTTYLVPRPLALTAPFAEMAPKLVKAVNRILTPIVDQGYSSLTPKAGPSIASDRKLVFNGPTATVEAVATTTSSKMRSRRLPVTASTGDERAHASPGRDVSPRSARKEKGGGPNSGAVRNRTKTLATARH